MSDVMVGLRSLTEANRAQRLLERRAIRCRVSRMPHRPGAGCAYGLRLQESDWERAQTMLHRGGIRPLRVTREADGVDLL